MKRSLLIPFLALCLFSCEKEEPRPVVEEPAPVVELKSSISCGDSWSATCLDANWDVSKTSAASLTVEQDGYNGKNSLYFSNPHDPNEVNPQPLRINTYIKNIKKDTPYKISFYAKIKGYPDMRSNPSLAAYVFTKDAWYGEMYYGSEGGEYHTKDWSKYSFTIIGKDEPTVNFELYSLYDNTWISDLKIEAM
ncbi:carbohydrate binding domain-containing protein [Adhaeribacter terreus]|uniref:Carbohydrate binding domain-containing protein n=1 Tax=Adhaeribacter terreus TaxID=529703 RepID=A0ABW0E9V1_9BACT